MKVILKYLAVPAVALALLVAPAQAVPNGGGPTVSGQLAQIAYCLNAMFHDVPTYEAECQPGPGPVDLPGHEQRNLPWCDYEPTYQETKSLYSYEWSRKMNCRWRDDD